MTGRETILERIRQNKPGQSPLPECISIENKSQPKKELVARFIESLKTVGAEVRECSGKDEGWGFIKDNIHGAVNLLDPNVKEEYSGVHPNEELGKIETVILEGQIGVAENGAIGIDETNTPNRLLPFVTQQLVVVLDKNKVVGNMHEAYKLFDVSDKGFGTFISGPSKTADIEQSLVYGAHGAKELMVVVF